jgi:hypothetical protein
MEKIKLLCQNKDQTKAVFRQIYDIVINEVVNGNHVVLEAKPKTRSLEQNARLWAMLSDISEQVVWHGRKLTADEWKHVFSAALKKQDVVPSIDGGFVVLGQSTSKMTVKEMCDMQELMTAFAAERNVKFRYNFDNF